MSTEIAGIDSPERRRRPVRIDDHQHSYDVVVIGGGAAGLSGALTLARARRSVVVVDAGKPRNAPADAMHGLLTRDGMAPLDLLKIGRSEVEDYGVRFVDGLAVDAAPTDRGFAVTVDDGTVLNGRRLLVATGSVDELPDVEGLADRWGRDVLHCPYCHGWEFRDQPIGVLASGGMSAHQAQMFRQWTADLTLFRHTWTGPSPEEAEELSARGIEVVDGRVVGLLVEDDRLTGVRLEDGTVVPRTALVITPDLAPRGNLLQKLGLRLLDRPVAGGSALDADEQGLTPVGGVWVAGNVTDPTAQVVGAAADGVKAASAINSDLVEAEIREAVARRRAAGAA